MSDMGQTLPVRKARTHVSSTPESCRSCCTRENVWAKPALSMRRKTCQSKAETLGATSNILARIRMRTDPVVHPYRFSDSIHLPPPASAQANSASCSTSILIS
jgi:hypothetical protein